MNQDNIRDLITQTAGEQPDSLAPVSGGLSNAGKFKAQVCGQDWMIKILPGNAVRDLWYKELAVRSDDRMACPKKHHLFEDGTLCLMSPWIEGESLETRLLRGSKEDLQHFGQQAAQILLKLHQIPFVYPGYVKQLRDRVYRACAQAEELQLTFPQHEQCCDFLRSSMENYSADHVCFVHKDIRPENFVVKDEQLYLMDHLVKLGYNILSVDLRGHGRSEGKYYGLGYLDQFDIAEWINYATNKSQCDRVNLFGISMGGATALMAAAYTPDRVSKIITDSAPADFISMFTRILSGKLRALTPLVIGTVSLYNRIFAGYWLRDASAASVVSKITAPVLFIHGQSDGFVPVSMVGKLYDECTAPKSRLIIENADHTKAAQVDPELYWSTVGSFLVKE